MNTLFLTPEEIADACTAAARKKASLPIRSMLILAVFAGAFIAFGGVASVFANTYVNRLAGAAVFPAGLAMVLVAGSELFTGNSLMFLGVLRREIRLSAMLKNWLFVYLGNFLGAILVAAAAVYGGLFDGETGTALLATASAKSSLPFLSALLRGILCNILVCTAVWMAFGARSVGGKIAGMYLPILAFVLSGFEHSVANMFYLPAGIFCALKNGAEAISPLDALIRNLLPVTLGNIIGGALFVAAGYFLAFRKKPEANP
ncbi:MAG: formate/nitrite transporter family protein [Clostridia bacterium]|nr:formate/nitrite transporter family protein [Clostridia bacterium]